MDPLTLGLSAVGFGMQVFSGLSGAGHAKQAANIQKQIQQQEMAANDVRRQQFEMQNRRQTLEIFRNSQRARAQAMAVGVNQGAQFGSGVAGGQAQIYNQSLYNAQGVHQNAVLGGNLFAINNNISGYKQQLADVQGSMAEDQAWGQLGGSLMKNAGTIGNIGGALGNFKLDLSSVGFNPIRGVGSGY
jgi:hypothetical protein